MERQDINLIINNFLRILERSGDKAATGFDIESIHQFRITYKKLRAFLRMLSDDVLFNRKIKIPHKIKTAYIAAGETRDLQLHNQYIRKTTKKIKGAHSTFKLYIDETERKKQFFAEAYYEINFSKARKEILSFIPGNFSSESFILFIKNKWEVINSIIAARHFGDNKIHYIRKNLKDLFYNLKLFKGSGYSTFCKLACKNKSINYFENLLKNLGNFQDTCVSIRLAKKYNNKSQYRSTAKWKAEKKKNKREIIANLKTITIT